MKVAIFCRVSTQEQATHGVSIRDQRERGIRFCLDNNFEYEVFEEPGYSGSLSIENRPVMFELLKKTEGNKKKKLEPECGAVYITDFDRISRDDVVFPTIKQHFVENDIIIYDNGEIVDLKDPTTNLMVSIKGSLASFEIKKTRERIKRSLERSVIEGKSGGGPLQNYGYKKDKDKKLIINNEEAEIVKTIYSLAIQGMGTKKIAEFLNGKEIPTKRNNSSKGKMTIKGKVKNSFEWRDSVIYRILTNPIYCGERIFKKKIYPAPSIISKKEFDYTQNILKQRKNFKDTTNKFHYLLKGLIICPNCDSFFYGRKRDNLRDNQYICSSQRYKTFCGNRGINIDRLDNIIWSYVIDLPDNIQKLVVENNDKYMSDLLARIEKLKGYILTQELRKDKILEQIIRNERLEQVLQSNLDNTAEKIEVSKQKLSKLEREFEMGANHGNLINILKSQIEPFKNKTLTIPDKQKVLRSLISFVVIKWIEKIGQHIIFVQFKISDLSDLTIQGIAEVNYEKLGFHYKEKKINYQFRIINPKTEIKKLVNGKVETKIHVDKVDFGFAIEDDLKIIEKFKFLMSKRRKEK
jgi:site-specific DNA recombinase